MEELDAILKKKLKTKATCFDEIATEFWKTRKFEILLQLCNAVYKNLVNEKLHPPLPPKKSNLCITKNYKCITLTAIC